MDSVNRHLITSLGGTDLCLTEFVRVVNHLLPKKIFYQYCPELLTQSKTSAGTPVLVQLLGSDPEALAANAARAVELGAAGVDLNFGCPAKTVNNNDGGAALLKSPERIHRIVETVRKAVPLSHTVSAKIRLGFDHKNQTLEIAQAAESAGASWLVIHARTKMDGYKPPAYWENIAPVKETLKIPVIANGEVWSVEDYHRCRQRSGCDHVMIGRGWIANPGIGVEIKTGKAKAPWSHWQNYFLQFFKMSMEYRHERYAVQRTKQLTKMMGQSYGEAQVLMQKIKTLEAAEPMLEMIKNNFCDDQLEAPLPQVIVAHKFTKSPLCQSSF